MESAPVEIYGHWTHMLYHFTIKDTVDWLGESMHKPWRSTKIFFTLIAIKLLQLFRPRKKAPLPCSYKDDVVYIHMFPRSFTKKVVNLSPYAIKVETWCRMKGVPYEVVETSRFSSREGQIPWMMLNGEETADSGSIIAKLRTRYQVKSTHLTPEMRSIQRATSRMLDDSFAGIYLWYRYFVEADEFRKYFRVTSAPSFLQSYILNRMGNGLRTRAVNMGFARYGLEHSIELGEQDIQALSDLLGDKEYFLGDTPSELDATVFGHLTQIVCPDMPYPWKTYIRENCSNLERFCDRIKSVFWTDWDSLVSTGIFE